MLRGLAALHATEARKVIATLIKKRFATLTAVLVKDEVECGKAKNQAKSDL